MSPLQAQYPLSPRKFWKKVISKLLGWAFLLVFLLAFWWLFALVDSIGASSTAPAWANSVLGMAVLALVAGIVIGMFAYMWYVRVYIRRYYYDANEHFVTIKKGVFAPTEIHVQYAKIQDVYVDQDILDRIMGLYDVHIASATATSGIEAHIDGVEHDAAEGLKNLLLERIRTGGSSNPQSPVAAQPAASAQGPVNLSEHLSSKEYPIQDGWVLQNLITYFFSALVISAFAAFYLAAPDKNSNQSIADIFNISVGGVWFWSFLIIFAFHIVYALVWKSTYYFEFLPEYVLMRSGIVSRREVHIPYRTLQDVVVSQSILERLLGLATVNLQNAAAPQVVGRRVMQSGVSIPGQSLEKANHISDIVKKVVLGANPSQTGL